MCLIEESQLSQELFTVSILKINDEEALKYSFTRKGNRIDWELELSQIKIEQAGTWLVEIKT